MHDSDTYERYTSTALEQLGLTHGGLLLFALLSKGDYSNGLDGCGPTMAAALARCGFGDRLLDAASTLKDVDLTLELHSIVDSMRSELHDNSRGFLGARYPKIAEALTQQHLSIDRINFYLHPSASILSTNTAIDCPDWILREPSIVRIATFCRQTFHWTPKNIEKKVQNVLWPGVLLRMIISVRLSASAPLFFDDIYFLQPLLTYSAPQKICLTPKNSSKLIDIHVRSRKSHTGQWARIQFSTDSFAELLGPSAKGKRKSTAAVKSMKTWVRLEYIPNVVMHPSMGSPPPRPYPGSIVDLLDSIIPIAGPSTMIASTTAEPDSGSSSEVEIVSVTKKRKRDQEASDSDDQASTSNSVNRNRKRRRHQKTEFPADVEVIVISD